MSHDDLEFLEVLGKRYIWWKRPCDAASEPRRVIAQVMNLGDWDDVNAMQQRQGAGALREALRHAEAGQFNARSWSWWHYRLGLAAVGQVPALPTRQFG